MCLRPLATLRWQTTSVRIALCASTMWRCIAAHAMMCSVPAFMCSMTSMRQETCQPMHNNMTPVIQCRDPGSNWGPSDLRSDTLPTELSRLRMAFAHGNIIGVGCHSARHTCHLGWSSSPGFAGYTELSSEPWSCVWACTPAHGHLCVLAPLPTHPPHPTPTHPPYTHTLHRHTHLHRASLAGSAHPAPGCARNARNNLVGHAHNALSVDSLLGSDHRAPHLGTRCAV